MASVKFYLDKRSKKQDGTYPLKLTVSHQQKPFHVPLDLSIPEENWIGDKIEGNFPNKAFLNNYIRARYSIYACRKNSNSKYQSRREF